MDSSEGHLLSQRRNNQVDIINRLDILTSCVQALERDIAFIKNAICCGGCTQRSTLACPNKQNSKEELELVEESTVPKIVFNHSTLIDSIIQPKRLQNGTEGLEEENVNQSDLDRRYCISKAIQKHITKLIDVLPYQTCELQDLLLQSESCLTENENDIIKKQPTRKDQIRQLIRFIKGRSFKAISKFLKCSRDYSPEAIDLIWQTYDQLIREGVRETRCVYCRMTNAVDIKDLADYAYEKEILSDELHQLMTDCEFGVGTQTKLWHQLSVLSMKGSNNTILLDSILTYLCSTPKYKQYGEELKLLVQRNFRFECKCKDYKRSLMYGCTRVESFASSILSSSVCPASSVSNLSPRQSLRSLSSNSSGSQKRKPGNHKVRNFYFRPYNQRRPLKLQVSRNEKENTSPKYIHCSEDEFSNCESAAESSRVGTNCEETNPKFCTSFHSLEETQTGVFDSKHISQLSPISSKGESVESQETQSDTGETTLKVVEITRNSNMPCKEISRQSATRKTWPLKPGNTCFIMEENRFGDFSDSVPDFGEEDDDKESLIHGHFYYEESLCSSRVPRPSFFGSQEVESLSNHIPGSIQEAGLPSDRHEALPTFLQDVLMQNERTSGAEDKVYLMSLKRTNSIPSCLTLTSETVNTLSALSPSPLNSAEVRRICHETSSLEQINNTQYRQLSGKTKTKEDQLHNSNKLLCGSSSYGHSGGESDAFLNRDFYTQTPIDFHKENASPSTVSETETRNCCSIREITNPEMQNITMQSTRAVHREDKSASEPNISGFSTYSALNQKVSTSLSETTKEKMKRSLGRMIRDSVRKQRTINNQLNSSKPATKC